MEDKHQLKQTDTSPTDRRHLRPAPAAQACCSSKQELEFDREGRKNRNIPYFLQVQQLFPLTHTQQTSGIRGNRANGAGPSHRRLI